MVAFAAGFARTAVLSLLAFFGALRLGLGLYAWRAANVLEKPAYSVLQRLPGGVEIRKYEPYLIAETTIPASSAR